MGTNHGIRRARLTDAPEMVRLAAALGHSVAADEMAQRLTALLPNEYHLIAVAASGRALSGWAHVEHRFAIHTGERAELMGLVVDPESRRRGVGRALVAVAEEWTRVRGLSALTVRSNVVRPEAHVFYASIGCTRSKTQHVYVKAIA